VTPTGTLFWIVSAMVVACAHFQRSTDAESAEPTTHANKPRAMAPPAPTALAEAAADGVLLGLALIALGSAFLDAFKRPYQPGMVLWNGLTLLGQPTGARYPVVAILVAATLLFGTLLFSLQPDARASLSVTRRARRTFASGALLGLLYWSGLAFLLAHFGIPVNDRALLVSRGMEQGSASNTSFYVSCLLVVLLFALLCAREGTEQSPRRLPLPWWRGMAAVGCALLGLSLIVRVSLRPAAAEAALALGNALEKLEQNMLAEEAYQLAAELGPSVEGYQAMLAKAYAEHARVDPAHAAAWYERADNALREAIARNHIDTENATNLAGFRANWALAATGRRRAVLQATVADLYARALRLNPQHPGLWRRWAITQLTLLHDAPGALESARHAVKLAPTRAADAYALIAECQMALARSRTGEPRREGFLDAAASYRKAIELAPNEALYRASEGTALLDAGQPAKAALSLRAALAAIPATSPAGKTTADALQRAESSAALVAAADPQQ
jgi:tetratricopeptide (TPR) repeat protein